MRTLKLIDVVVSFCALNVIVVNCYARLICIKVSCSFLKEEV